MEFFLDIDGVILDFETAFINLIREEYITDLPAGYEPLTWEMADEFKELDIEEVWKKFINSPRFSQLDLLINSESFNALSGKHPVYLVTNIPHAQFAARQKNLHFHNLVYKEMCLAGHFNFGLKDYPTKSAAIKKLRTPSKRLIFLDDHPKNCRDIKQNLPAGEVYLMSRPHNKNLEDTDWIRVDSWQDFLRKVL